MQILNLDCPGYNFLDGVPNLEAIASDIDVLLIRNLSSREIVLRAVQSGKHKIDKNNLVEYIKTNGTDYDQKGDGADVIYGKKCLVELGANISLSILEGFHKFKPTSLEKPQYPADIWLIYDPDELENIRYIHHHYGVEASDKYTFINPQEKQRALIGILIIN